MQLANQLDEILTHDYAMRRNIGWAKPVPSLSEVRAQYPRRRGNFLHQLRDKTTGRRDKAFAEAKRGADLARCP
jgi:hypothetical protein